MYDDLNDLMKHAKKAALGVLVVLLVVILLQNIQVSTIHILFWSVSMSQIVLSFITLVIGVTIGFIVHVTMVNKQKRDDRSSQNKNGMFS